MPPVPRPLVFAIPQGLLRGKRTATVVVEVSRTSLDAPASARRSRMQRREGDGAVVTTAELASRLATDNLARLRLAWVLMLFIGFSSLAVGLIMWRLTREGTERKAYGWLAPQGVPRYNLE